MAAWEALSCRALSLRDCWVTASVLILSSCHNNITELFASGRTQVVMDTPIRWKVKRRFKEVRLSVLLVFLMFVTSRVSAGKQRISSSQTVTLCRGPRSPGAALLHRQSAVPGLEWPQEGMVGALEWDFSTRDVRSSETLEQRRITESGTFPRAMQQLREEIVMHLVYAAPSWCNTHYSYAN